MMTLDTIKDNEHYDNNVKTSVEVDRNRSRTFFDDKELFFDKYSSSCSNNSDVGSETASGLSFN